MSWCFDLRLRVALKKSVVYDYGRLGYANTIMYVCMYLDIYTAPIKTFYGIQLVFRILVI